MLTDQDLDRIAEEAAPFYAHVHPRVAEAIRHRLYYQVQYAIWDSALWEVDPTGCYNKLIAAPPWQFWPTEDVKHKNHVDVARYARMYRNGTMFPPLSVIGPPPGRRQYRLSNGHRRWLASWRVKGVHAKVVRNIRRFRG